MIIIRDSREQQPWTFDIYDCTVEKGTLHTGDYTLRGFESVLVIERKKSTGEIAMNLGSKWKQFSAELERMAEFRYKYLILEFSLQDLLDFPKGSGIPQKALGKLRMSGKFMISRLTKFCDQHGIELIFANNRSEAAQIAWGIFREVNDEAY